MNREISTIIGTLGALASPIIFAVSYIPLNSTFKRVETSQGEVLVRNWYNSPKGIDVSRGYTTLSDFDRDGRPDIKRWGLIGRQGPCQGSGQPTEQDCKLYIEAISRAGFN